jgi:hypothetical protein
MSGRTQAILYTDCHVSEAPVIRLADKDSNRNEMLSASRNLRQKRIGLLRDWRPASDTSVLMERTPIVGCASYLKSISTFLW